MLLHLESAREKICVYLLQLYITYNALTVADMFSKSIILISLVLVNPNETFSTPVYKVKSEKSVCTDYIFNISTWCFDVIIQFLVHNAPTSLILNLSQFTQGY